jgi:hypothetical protein
MRAPKMRPPVSVVEWHDCIPATCGLHLPESLSQDRWLAVGRTLCAVETSFSWWWGDWWRAYKPDWGQQRAITKDDGWNGPSYQTLVNLANVCSKFETNRRRLNLSFKHHAELTAMDPAAVEVMLDWCEAPIQTGGRARSVNELRNEKRSRRFIKLKNKITTHEIRLYPPGAVSAHPTYALNRPITSETEGKERYGGKADLQWYRQRVTELEKELEKETDEFYRKLEAANQRADAANQRADTLEAENQRLRRQIPGENDSNDHAPARTTPRLVH